jgi:hypothetical protein
MIWKDTVMDMYTIERKNRINTTKQKAYELHVKINFQESDFKAYVLDHEDLEYLRLCEGFFGPAILDARGYHAGLNHRYCKLSEIMNGEELIFSFKTETQRSYFEKSGLKKLSKFLNKNLKSFIKIKELALIENKDISL